VKYHPQNGWTERQMQTANEKLAEFDAKNGL
jgi:hypothetical protein